MAIIRSFTKSLLIMGYLLCFIPIKEQYLSVKKNTLFDDENTYTQFSYACHTLGVDIKTTSVPQAKGRIERLNQTFQARLPVELRRAHVSNIDEANEFLKSYLKKFND